MRDLQGKVALITGGSTDTAQAVALTLAEQGVEICLTGQQLEILEHMATVIQAKGRRCLAFTADVTQEKDVERLVAATLQTLGRLDILILISAVWGGGAIHSHNIRTWDLVMAANLRANFLMARAVLPTLRAQGNGYIVIIASESAQEYYEGEGAYGISMHALFALSEYIRRENREIGIQVSCLCPGLVFTPQAGQERDAFLTPQDVADSVVWSLTEKKVE